ncbi:MAG: hypothetical protein KAX84_15675 [Burkholderiales bacterium]|nr:hypothetical protein [Burkholderiales bacterium]
MCTGISMALMAVSAAAGAVSSIQQGRSQAAWADYQAEQAQADANAERGAAEVQAEKIRKMARIQAGEARAQLAGSGVDVGEGTALNINADIYGRAEEDAVMTIFGGSDRARRGEAEAAGLKMKGAQAQQAGYLNATSSILSAASTVAKGYKTTTRGT